jgi:hypothetical protein
MTMGPYIGPRLEGVHKPLDRLREVFMDIMVHPEPRSCGGLAAGPLYKGLIDPDHRPPIIQDRRIKSNRKYTVPPE